jgi:2-keto-4-pentenoate hydratase/2-oxohepta-3-ene-1,7-dioic acid hydratase in catechol pathway
MQRHRISPLNLPINTVFCIGRNYADHAKELNNTVPVEPMVFLKPNSCIEENPNEITLPSYSNDVHHEVEIVVALKSDAFNIEKEEAVSHIGALAIGIDLTARDTQNVIKQKGHPWTKAKCFTSSALLSDWVVFDKNSHDLNNLPLTLSVNQQIRQNGNSSDMIFSIPTIISYLSKQFPLYAGDIIYTGTPAGVAQLHSNDTVDAELKDTDCRLHFTIC